MHLFRCANASMVSASCFLQRFGGCSLSCAAYTSTLCNSCALGLGHQWHCSFVLFPTLCALEINKAAGQTREAERPGCLLAAGLSSLDAVRTTFEKMAMGEVQLVIHFLCSNTHDSRFAEADQWDCLCSMNSLVHSRAHLCGQHGLATLSNWRN